MGFNSLKIVMGFMLAVIFSAAQLICVCQDAGAFEAQPHSHSHTEAADHTSGHSHDVAENTSGHSHGSSETHNHSGDCSDCDSVSVLTAQFDSSVQSESTSDFATLIALASAEKPSFTLSAKPDHASLAWLDPPRQTPVSQKIRLLT